MLATSITRVTAITVLCVCLGYKRYLHATGLNNSACTLSLLHKVVRLLAEYFPAWPAIRRLSCSVQVIEHVKAHRKQEPGWAFGADEKSACQWCSQEDVSRKTKVTRCTFCEKAWNMKVPGNKKHANGVCVQATKQCMRNTNRDAEDTKADLQGWSLARHAVCAPSSLLFSLWFQVLIPNSTWPNAKQKTCHVMWLNNTSIVSSTKDPPFSKTIKKNWLI